MEVLRNRWSCLAQFIEGSRLRALKDGKSRENGTSLIIEKASNSRVDLLNFGYVLQNQFMAAERNFRLSIVIVDRKLSTS